MSCGWWTANWRKSAIPARMKPSKRICPIWRRRRRLRRDGYGAASGRGPFASADFYGSLLDNNIKAMYNIMAAAKEQGCRRVVYASSVQVIEGYPLDVQPKATDPVKPMNLYAVTKAYAEALGHYFAYAEGLSNVAVRIGAFEGNRVHQDPDARTLSVFVSKARLEPLVRAVYRDGRRAVCHCPGGVRQSVQAHGHYQRARGRRLCAGR